MRIPGIWLFMLTGMSVFHYAGAQDLYFEHFDHRRGLPTPVIYDLEQDQKGYIYLGTEKGLLRFNGYSFTQIPLRNSRTASVTGIFIDHNGRLWCRNFSNQIFYWENDTMHPLKTEHKWFKDENILEVKPVGKEIGILTESTFFLSDPEKPSLNLISKSDVFYTGMEVTEDLTVWLAETEGKLKKIHNGKISENIPLLSGLSRLCPKDNTILSTAKEDSDGRVFILEKNKFRVFIEFPGLRGKNTNTFSRSGNLIGVSTNEGLFLADEKGNTYLFKESDTRISDFLRDREGNLWVSSLNNGLFLVPSLEIRLFRPEPGNEKFVHLESGHNGSFFASTDKGKIWELSSDGNPIDFFDTRTENDVEFLFLDSSAQTLYFSQGSFRLGENRSFRPFYWGKSVSRDPEGNVFYCTHSRSELLLVKHNPLTIALTATKASPEKIFTIRKMRGRAILFDHSESCLYIGYADGLFRYKADGSCDTLQTPEGENIFATSLVKGTDGTIWVSTTQSGIWGLKNGKLTSHFHQGNGLSGDICKKIRLKGNHIYVVTDEGVDRVEPKKNEIANITRQAGVEGLNWSDVLPLDGFVLCVSQEGILKIPNPSDKDKAVPAKIIFKEIIAAEKRIAFPFESSLSFDAGTENIRFVFDILSFSNPKETKVQYRLLPSDSAWKLIPPDAGFVQFNTLTHGQYTFEIRVQGEDKAFRIPFGIEKPLTATPLFYAGTVAAVLFLLYLTMFFTRRFTRNRQLLKEKIIRSQLTALRAQMNPHFISLVSDKTFKKKQDFPQRISRFHVIWFCRTKIT